MNPEDIRDWLKQLDARVRRVEIITTALATLLLAEKAFVLFGIF